MDVSIIIINYNTKELIDQCINSIISKTNDTKYEIIVVDNASSDNSQEFIVNKYPMVKWIQSAHNLGFGKANNLGVKYACGRYILFLNPDTILKNDAISMMYEFVSKKSADHHNIGVIGGYLIDANNRLNTYAGDIIKYTQPLKDILNTIKKRIIKTKADISNTSYVGYVSGADMFMSKDLFVGIGGFDENFFMYCEEVDLQKRILETGRRNLIIPGPKIIHLEGGGEYKSKGLSIKQYIMSQD